LGPFNIKINDLNYQIAIATNQPAFAKGKNTKENLSDIHNYIVNVAESKGAKIFKSAICWHKSEDNCNCRKPKPGMLEEIFEGNNFNKSKSWMVGDKTTDIIAGASFGVKTALLNYSSDELRLLNCHKTFFLHPNYLGSDLRDFLRMLRYSCYHD
jgi:D-glycero-D-manno-heptose 1,7-bisphosphate phosphatase